MTIQFEHTHSERKRFFFQCPLVFFLSLSFFFHVLLALSYVCVCGSGHYAIDIFSIYLMISFSRPVVLWSSSSTLLVRLWTLEPFNRLYCVMMMSLALLLRYFFLFCFWVILVFTFGSVVIFSVFAKMRSEFKRALTVYCLWSYICGWLSYILHNVSRTFGR